MWVCLQVFLNMHACDCASIFFPFDAFFFPLSLLFTEVPYPDMWELGHIAHYHPTLIKVPILETDSCCHVPWFQWLSVPVAAQVLSWPAEVVGGTRVNRVCQFKLLLEQFTIQHIPQTNWSEVSFFLFFSSSLVLFINAWRCYSKFQR